MDQEEITTLRSSNESLTRELLSAYEELELLHTLAEIFATSSDVNEMGERLVGEAVDNLGASGGFLAFTGEEMAEFEPVLRGITAEEVQAFVAVVAPRILQGEAVLLDVAVAEGFEPRPLLTVPLRSREGIFGALGLLREPGGTAFTAGEKKALSVLATQASAVILQKLNVDLTYLSERLRESNESLHALLEISRELTATLDVDRVLAAIVNLPGKVIAYDRASIALLEGTRWRLRTVSGTPQLDRTSPQMAELEDLLAWVGERGEELRIELDSAVESAETERFRDQLRRWGTASVLALPLADEEGVLGVLAVERSQGPAPAERGRELLSVLANQATVALRNAQLYSQVPLIGVLEPILERRRRIAQSSPFRRLAWIGGVIAVTAFLFLVPIVPLRVGGSVRLVPAQTVSVSAGVAGRVAEVGVRDGEPVRRGQTLARLDDRDYLLQEGEARARVEAARRQVRQLEASQDPRSAHIERVRLDRYLQEEAMAAAAVQETMLRAPADGVVLTHRVQEKVGERLDAGDVFCVLAELDPLEAEVMVPESEMAYVSKGMLAEVKLAAYPKRTFPGLVTALRPTAEEREGHTVLVARVRLPNSRDELRPGMQGRGRIIAGKTTLGNFVLRRPLRWVRSWFWF
jgi:RND family efflux transporter MFP subunit